MEENKNIYTKLLNIQSKLKAPKNQLNKFGGYKYRSCEDILEAVKPHLFDEKLALVISDEVALINNRFYVVATITLYDTESDKTIITKGYAREEEIKKGMDSSQITGASSSYARKYALNAMFLIDDTKDSDYTNDQIRQKINAIKNNVSVERQQKILEYYKAKTIEELKDNEIIQAFSQIFVNKGGKKWIYII